MAGVLLSNNFSSNKVCFFKLRPHSPFHQQFFRFPSSLRIYCADKARRTGKLRYPSERRKLKHRQLPQFDVATKPEGVWRLSMLGVSVHEDPGKDFYGVSEALMKEIAKVLEFPVASMLPQEAFTVVRKSFDVRKKEPKFVYTVDMDLNKMLTLEPRTWEFLSELKPKVGRLEFLHPGRLSRDLVSTIRGLRNEVDESSSPGEVTKGHNIISQKLSTKLNPKVMVVGSGPSGLFASLVLAELGADVTIVERGNAVEQRGRDIGALVARRMLQPESNFCFGEGGAGTWSDGKLVTRIGKNNNSVLTVLKTLVYFGAPYSILVDGKPHLGTDRLIPLLRNFRQYLQGMGVTMKFGARLDDLLVKDDNVTGIKISDSTCKFESHSQNLDCDAVVLAIGHSARDTYQMLMSHNVNMVPKDFAVGLRVEHPQQLINTIQYSGLASEVRSGRGKVPVADYHVAEYIDKKHMSERVSTSLNPSSRSCYSFCMCPGGQVVLTSTDPSEICINGMSFSRRSSRWANAALAVTVSSKDFNALDFFGPLAGVEFQRMHERKAALMGGGNFVVPAQTITDFLNEKLSVLSLPSSSYRLGVKAANLHELFPSDITEALQHAIAMFDKELPGFISSSGLVHGVETRTSSPIQITRSSDTWESTSLRGLYPVGEGAGYAGGIVSAAVDGMYAGFAVARNLGLVDRTIDSVFGSSHIDGRVKY